MFGYITVNEKVLSEEEKDRYRQLYCGLCFQLREQFGSLGRMTLNYDMVFLAMILSSLYQEEETHETERCPVHPVSGTPYIISDATKYAADISMVLTYYKCLDDWNDDHNVIALAQLKAFEKKVEEIAVKYPRQCSVTVDCLKEISTMEKRNELNPDGPTNAFGVLMGELFVRQEDQWSDSLRRLGAALGRFIYLIDAVCDLHDDIKKERYNPLVAQLGMDFEPILTMIIGECTEEFEKLPLERDVNLMRSILYSGVWLKYRTTKKEGTE